MGNEQKITNYLGMARTAEIGGNQAEALDYYNRVLEIDPTVPDAWFGKGKAAVWQSSLANFRINEAVIAFNHAISNTSNDQLDAMEQMSVDEINAVVSTMYSMARQNLEEFAALDDTWPSYVGQVAQMTDALEAARLWKPNDRVTLENIVHLCKDNIEGFSFRDSYNNGMPGAYSLSDDYEAVLREQMNRAVEALRLLDSSYEPPQIDKKQADACFVVTATMGDFHHPNVTLLRKFRDTWLARRPWGNSFIGAYYRAGPKIASAIERSRFLKFVSYWLIVRPAAALAKKLM